MKVAAIGVAVLACAFTVGAHDLPQKPQPQQSQFGTVHLGVVYPERPHAVERITLDVPHKTADKAFWTLNGTAWSLTAVDLALARTNLAREANPVMRKNIALAIGLSAGATALSTYLSHRYKRQDDALTANGIRRPMVKWWWFPAVPIVGHAAAIAVSLAGGI